ncbi:acyltransferase [Kitasatospora sp. CB02891]|uniref:acyltransferase family protein n=1 Tax=Kitasatospora sp. CB02891 TaxID=2020329 RepID=UPI000C27AAE7|nr:acyltransferase [Kitasatospora sp. CB02891]PJN26164.1 acyltransferase [Kitasatospora sp. CB02891]
MPLRSPDRNHYADLLRVAAICAVVLGHWLLTDVTYRNGRVSGQDALDVVGWGRWITLLFQVMPVVFLVGGYANAVSWTGHRDRGEGWADWVRRRALRLLWPTAVYVGTVALAAAAAWAGGADPGELAQAGWYLALHLWFLPVYLLLIALTPALHAAHTRWGLAVPAAMAVGAALVDVAILGPRLPLVGFANYLLVWGAMHQWGFAWHDGSLTRGRRPLGLALAGALLLVGLLTWGPFPVDMVGAGLHAGNTTPPSIALLAFAAAQCGLLLAAEPAGRRLLAAAPRRDRLARLNRAAMTVYLWHPVPVLLVAVTLYPVGLAPQPSVGSWQWFALRPAWFAVLTALLVALVAVLQRVQRPLLTLTARSAPGTNRSPALLLGGLAAVLPALAWLAVNGFAPSGRPAALALAAFACGFALVLRSGRRATAPPHRRW